MPAAVPRWHADVMELYTVMKIRELTGDDTFG